MRFKRTVSTLASVPNRHGPAVDRVSVCPTGPTMNNDYGAFPSAHIVKFCWAYGGPLLSRGCWWALCCFPSFVPTVEAHWPSNVVFGADLVILLPAFVLDWE